MKTIYTEHYNTRAANWILSLKKADLRQRLDWNVNETDETGNKFSWNGHYTQVIDLCKRIIANDGDITTSYKYASGRKAGREYGTTFSLQNIAGKIRDLLISDEYRDLDMKNAHPTILKYLCDNNEIACPLLSRYIEHRDLLIAKGEISNKREVLVAMNSDVSKSQKLYIRALVTELDPIKMTLLSLYGDNHDLTTTNTANPISSSLNQLLCIFENKILQKAMNIDSTNLSVSKCFDGFQTTNPNITVEDLNSITEEYNIKWAKKDRGTGLTVPEDFVEKEIDETPDETYADYKTEFEKKNFFCNNPPRFCRLSNGIWTFIKASDFATVYESTPSMIDPSSGSRKKIKFINIWRNDVNRLTYENIDTIPYSKHPSACPASTFNMWVPFNRITDRYDALEGKSLEWFETYLVPSLKAITGDDVDQFEYMMKYIAHIIQKPEVLPKCIIVLKGREGIGKDALLDFIAELINNKNLICRTNNVELVLGNFNKSIENKLIIQLNEMSDKDAHRYKEELKCLSTAKTMECNKKGVDAYQITNYSRIFIFTNNTLGAVAGVDNRRQLHLEGKDTYMDNKEFWSGYYEGLENDTIMNDVFSLFYNSDIETFNPTKFKISENCQNIMANSIQPLFRYLHEKFKSKVEFPFQENEDKSCRLIANADLLQNYKAWLLESGEKNACEWSTATKLKSKLTEIEGVIANGKRLKKVCEGRQYYHIDVKKMTDHLNHRYFNNGKIVTKEEEELDLTGFKEAYQLDNDNDLDNRY